MRDNFVYKTRSLLAARVGHRCSICNSPTSGPSGTTDKSVNMGVAAHITAASPSGPRFDGSFSAAKRAHYENGIWLCQYCARLIDVDPATFPAHALRKYKDAAEALAGNSLAAREANAFEFLSLGKVFAGELSGSTYMPGAILDVFKYYRTEYFLVYEGKPLPFSLLWSGSISVEAVKISQRHGEFKLPNELESRIENFVEAYRRSGRAPVYNSEMVRLEGVHIGNDTLSLNVSKTTYFNHIASNFASEVIVEHPQISVRDRYEPGPQLSDLPKSLMSNHVGLNCAVITSDGKLICSQKSRFVIHDPGKDEISVSGSWKWSLDQNVSNLAAALLLEIREELAIQPGEVTQISVVGLLRDLRKGGKPELYFRAGTSLSFEDCKHRHVKRESRGYWQFETLDYFELEDLSPAKLKQLFSRPRASANLKAFCAIVSMASGTTQR
jgi:ribosomal protein L37AE/L43A